MKPNVGGADRVIRVIIGLVILAAGYWYHSWWGLIGLIPLGTGLFRVCCLYVPFGISTCRIKEKNTNN